MLKEDLKLACSRAGYASALANAHRIERNAEKVGWIHFSPILGFFASKRALTVKEMTQELVVWQAPSDSISLEAYEPICSTIESMKKDLGDSLKIATVCRYIKGTEFLKGSCTYYSKLDDKFFECIKASDLISFHDELLHSENEAYAIQQWSNRCGHKESSKQQRDKYLCT